MISDIQSLLMQLENSVSLLSKDENIEITQVMISAIEKIKELSAWQDQIMTDCQRALWVDDVKAVCKSPDICHEYGSFVPCLSA